MYLEWWLYIELFLSSECMYCMHHLEKKLTFTVEIIYLFLLIRFLLYNNAVLKRRKNVDRLSKK